MTRFTKSFTYWCMSYHKDLIAPLMFGHVESFTEELQQEYLDWCKTEEARPYLEHTEEPGQKSAS